MRGRGPLLLCVGNAAMPYGGLNATPAADGLQGLEAISQPCSLRSNAESFCSRHAFALPAGKFALVQFPFVYQVLSPLDPLLRVYTGIPFAS